MERKADWQAAPDTRFSALFRRMARYAEVGAKDYPPATRRRLAVVNVMALLIAVFSAVYAALFLLYDAKAYLSLVVANLLLVAVALLVPLIHRINDHAAPVFIAMAEYVALFFFVRALGHDSGIQLNYIIGAAVPFAIVSLSRPGIIVGIIGVGVVMHLIAWFMFPAEKAQVPPDPGLLANLYISSAVTTGAMIALIVGYAFSTAEKARAQTDAVLARILPESIAERLKLRPGELIADTVGEASVMFTDLVGFTPMAQRLGAEDTVRLLDRLVSEFDRLAAPMASRRSRPSAMAIWRSRALPNPRPTMRRGWREWRSNFWRWSSGSPRRRMRRSASGSASPADPSWRA